MTDTNTKNEIASDMNDSNIDKKEPGIQVTELSEETKSMLVNDYAPLAALLKQLDQQVSSFTGQMEQIAYKAAPDYEGLTERWTQEAIILKGEVDLSA